MLKSKFCDKLVQYMIQSFLIVFFQHCQYIQFPLIFFKHTSKEDDNKDT